LPYWLGGRKAANPMGVGGFLVAARPVHPIHVTFNKMPELVKCIE
jgi:hypothetical protein